jgi:hypothetical protein
VPSYDHCCMRVCSSAPALNLTARHPKPRRAPGPRPPAGLFSWQQAPPASVQRTAAYLLGLAATGPPCSREGGSSGLAPESGQAHLEAARALAGRAAAGEKLAEADLATAEAAARALTLAALGLLHLAQGVLSSTAAYEDDRCVASAPALLAILRRIWSAAPRHAAAVVAALQRALCAMGARRPELAERVCAMLVDLLLEGHMCKVLAAVEAWAAGGADPSLVRAFVLRVLEHTGPPYSREFAHPLLRLTLMGKMGVAKKAGTLLSTAGAVERLREFAVFCLESDFVVALSDQESDLLERLAA